MSGIRKETTLDLVILIQQRLEAYKDHSTELVNELKEIEELLEQLESRIPLVNNFVHVKSELGEDAALLCEADPDGIIYYMSQVRHSLEFPNG